MKRFFLFFLWFALRFVLSLRYRVRVKGLKEIDPGSIDPTQGSLLLANHPAEIDPPILVTFFWKKFKPHPVALESLFHKPFVSFFLKMVGAIPIPNFEDSSNSFKRKQIEKTYDNVFKVLESGESLLLYPAGGLKNGPEEMMGGASGVHKILQQMPDLNVFLIRTKGLWGSSFSRALTGKSPDITQALTQGFLTLLKNLIFFTPRRTVTIEIEKAPLDLPRQASRMELNKALEKWYNQPPLDQLKLVSYAFWKEKFPQIASKKQEEEFTVNAAPAQVKERVAAEIAEITERDPQTIEPKQHLSKDLGLDSLDVSQLVVFLKEQYGVNSIHTSDLTTVGSVMLFAAHLKSPPVNDEEEEKDKKPFWHEKARRPIATKALGKTLIDSFLLQCDRMQKYPACVDAISGEMTYQRFKMGVIALADKIATYPGKYIGVMLPASIAVNMVILAVGLAGKVPVMINWTLGSRNLKAVVEQSGINVTISSWNFLDRLENIELDGIDDQIILLESIKNELSLFKKIKAFWLSSKSSKRILRKFKAKKINADDLAVILFTSGTESVPKGVPLSHRNLLSNQQAAFEVVSMLQSDILLGVLPPFHSFGFSVTGLLPLISGVRVAYSPNPTDGRRMASVIEKWNVTILCIAPTFLRNLLRVANSKQISHLRFVVAGAEKTPKEIYEKVASLSSTTRVLEGYGITECSPILTINPPQQPSRGVGKGGVGLPLPGVELLIVHPETYKPMQEGESGLILARGPNVFNGYLDPKLASPFVEIFGKKWYQTGDLGFLDKDGYLNLSGRLKRFVKIGGEMVSLALIEEVLSEACVQKKWHSVLDTPVLAVSAIENGDKKAEIILFTIFPITIDVVNRELREKGLSNLVRVSRIEKLTTIPLLGTGKINYRALMPTTRVTSV